MSDSSLHTLKHLILAKTDGTPFFMEEIVQELREQGALSALPLPTNLHIPPTVQAVLAARIDRLTPDEKALLQQLAVIGCQFPLSLAKQVVQQSEDELHRVLSSLQTKEFLYEQPAFPEVEYLFKHALTQDVAYGTVLQEQRKALHERTGHALEVLYQDNLDDHYSELAYHYQRSSNTEKAVEYLQLAGQQSAQRSANEEAVSHLVTALKLLRTLPDTTERARKELTLQVALVPSLIAAKGWADPQVKTVYHRAQELCHQEKDSSQLFTILWGLWLFHTVQANYEPSHKLGEQLLALARSENDTGLLVEASYVLAATQFWLGGEITAAREHAERGGSLYDPQQHHSLALLHGSFDPGVACFLYAALALWVLGYPQQGRQKLYTALALARDLSHPHSLAFATGFAALFHLLGHEEQAAQEQAEATITLATEQGMPVWLAFGTLYRGRALAELGQVEEGIARIHQGLAAVYKAAGQVGRPHWLALLVEAHGKAGQMETGLSVLAEALSIGNKTGERFYEAELYRLKGELTLGAGGWRLETSPPSAQAPSLKLQVPSKVTQEAEGYFLKAIAIAQKQHAKSWELRAATSLARLWQLQGKAAEARDLLAPVYNWFTEGFDTKDLQDAKALLNALSKSG